LYSTIVNIGAVYKNIKQYKNKRITIQQKKKDRHNFRNNHLNQAIVKIILMKWKPAQGLNIFKSVTSHFCGKF
jgi:uncharacterized phage-associated protein